MSTEPKCCSNCKHKWASSKLKPEQVQEIKKALLDYEFGLCAKLAKKYKVSVAAISAINTGKAHWL